MDWGRHTMTGMKRGMMLLLALVLLLGITLPSGCADEGTGGSGVSGGGEKEPYVLGAVLSLTGAQAGLGGPEKNAILMEVARINEEGGINGHPLEV
ncbi:MAG: ABC transporter substrate-binding protein, partial [Coriobacteriia bacterium]|nr:ABC transporter substrate-binding protein [Coriobacteriia bacterium]